ncbi:START domain-containing protein [Thalassolituus sp. LLYu03]|uniref:START domain-containing protein n=1 Tax=Thalassolituus sp. LLYu03 TaxID=3421656 RepID=UPI003D2C2649
MRLLLLALLFPAFCAVALDSDWELAKEDKDAAIRVYTRPVSGSDLREFRGELLVKARLASLVALVEDAREAPKWLHLCKAMELIEQRSPLERVNYMVSDAPWPVTDRDSVFVSELSQDSQTRTVTIRMTGAPGLFPKNDDYIRIPQMAGMWQFVPQADGQVLVVYQVHAEPGGGIPSWLSNSVVVDNPYYSLRNMIGELAKPAYRDAVVDHLSE